MTARNAAVTPDPLQVVTSHQTTTSVRSRQSHQSGNVSHITSHHFTSVTLRRISHLMSVASLHFASVTSLHTSHVTSRQSPQSRRLSLSPSPPPPPDESLPGPPRPAAASGCRLLPPVRGASRHGAGAGAGAGGGRGRGREKVVWAQTERGAGRLLWWPPHRNDRDTVEEWWRHGREMVETWLRHDQIRQRHG